MIGRKNMTIQEKIRNQIAIRKKREERRKVKQTAAASSKLRMMAALTG